MSEDSQKSTSAARSGSRALSRMVDSQKRQAREFVADVVRMRGLMPLLMKNRNGGAWTAAE